MTASSQAGQSSPLAMETVEQSGQENGLQLVSVKRTEIFHYHLLLIVL